MYQFECHECDTGFDLMMSISEYSDSDSWECTGCGCEVTRDNRIITASSVTRAMYVDGTKRAGFSEQREILSLTKESYNMKPEDRKDIKSTIKSIFLLLKSNPSFSCSGVANAGIPFTSNTIYSSFFLS